MSEKKKKTKNPTAPRPKDKPIAPRPKDKPDIHDEGSYTSTKVEVKKGGSLKKAIKYEIGGMVKPAYMRNR
tara:strand:+ start:719 stop:931 length:213 start_codon:yes stop_codon:yes gene_type:complete